MMAKHILIKLSGEKKVQQLTQVRVPIGLSLFFLNHWVFLILARTCLSRQLLLDNTLEAGIYLQEVSPTSHSSLRKI